MIWASWCYDKNPRTKLIEMPFCLSTLTINNLKLNALGLTFSLGCYSSYLYTWINVVYGLGSSEIGELFFDEFIRRPFVVAPARGLRREKSGELMCQCLQRPL